MRRGEKASGVIRPRTLGLGKVVTAPEPLAPPPPPPPAPGFLDNRKVRLTLLFGLLFFCALFFFKKDDVSDNGAPQPGSFSDSSLRSQSQAALVDNDGEDADEGDSSSKAERGDDDEESQDDLRKTGDDDRDSSDDADDDGGKTSDSEDNNIGKAAADDESEQPATGDSKHSSDNNGQDRSKTVESYFVNFGGRVIEIDREGSYKYVLVRMEDIFGSQALLVRGCPHKEGTHCKHADAFARAKTELELRGFKATALGGGRITRHPSRHQKGQKAGYISIFGYSKTFGACEECNKIACSLIKASFPDHGIKWANEGYLESDERKVRDDAWTRC